MVEKIGLNDVMRNALFKAAKIMVEEKKESLRVVTDDFEAFVQTEFKWAGFASIYGIEFLAEISSVRGDGEAHYIVRSTDIELATIDQGFWMACCEPWFAPPSSEVAARN